MSKPIELTLEEVAEIREGTSLQGGLLGHNNATIQELCDTVDALRVESDNLREQLRLANRIIETNTGTMERGTEQIRRLTAALREIVNSGVGFDDERIRYIRLTDALRDANQAIEAASSVMTDKQVAEAAEIQRRALAEGEGDD